MTHCDRILEYMRQHGSITQAEAYAHFGCARLSGRIYDLKKRGVMIASSCEIGRNRYGDPVHYAKYILLKEA